MVKAYSVYGNCNEVDFSNEKVVSVLNKRYAIEEGRKRGYRVCNMVSRVRFSTDDFVKIGLVHLYPSNNLKFYAVRYEEGGCKDGLFAKFVDAFNFVLGIK